MWYNSLDQCRALDRLRLVLPAGYPPAWRLHIVHVRPARGDRVYGFFRSGDIIAGAFAVYPDRLILHENLPAGVPAWPLPRPTPHQPQWFKRSAQLGEFIERGGLAWLPDAPMEPTSTEAWYVVFASGEQRVRRLAWFDRWLEPDLPKVWQALESHCIAVAQVSLRCPVQPRPVREQ